MDRIMGVTFKGISPSEEANNVPIVATVPSSRGSTVVLSDPSSSSSSSRSYDFGSLPSPPSSSSSPSLGNVFGPSAKQAMIYNTVAAPLLDQCLEGYNCTIFAYGQTGTGKTWTMEGDLGVNGATFREEAGIVPRCLYYLFDRLAKLGSNSGGEGGDKGEWTVKVSYLELYNEELRDLNSKEENKDLPLKIYDESPSSSNSNSNSSSYNNKSSSSSSSSRDSNSTTGTGGVRIEGLEETFINDAEEGLEVLRRGSMRRISASTNMNERSSRSHSIFTIIVSLRDPSSSSSSTSSSSSSPTPGGGGLLKVGKLNLVDLAGSENVARSGARDGRAREAGRINVSLLALGRVINSLSDREQGLSGAGGEKGHIPYRESKLTRLLQDSLGGNTKTSIIATISPTSYEETCSTLNYALQATRIQNKPEPNRKIGRDVVLNQVLGELGRCKADLKAARSEEGYYLSRQSFEEFESERQSFQSSLKNHLQTLTSYEILKTELSSTRDQLEQNVRALSRTKETLKRTQDDLGEREDELEGLRRELEEVRVENEKLKCLGEAWEKSRKGWKEDAEDARVEVKGLREKLARKTWVEETNLGVFRETEEEIGTNTSKINRQTKELQTNQEKFVKSLSSSLEEFSERQTSRFEENESLIAKSLEGISKGIENVVKGERGTREESMRFREIVEASCKTLFGKIQERERILSQEQEQLSRQLRTELTRHEQETSQLVDALVLPIQSLHSDCTQRLAQDSTLLSTLQQQELSSLSAENASLKQLVSRLSSNFASEQSHLASEHASLLSLLSNSLSQLTERRQKMLDETFALVEEKVGETIETKEKGVKERTEGMKALGEGREFVRRAMDERLGEAEKVREEGGKNFSTSIDLIKQLEALQTESSMKARTDQTRLLRNAASFVSQQSAIQRSNEARSRKEEDQNVRVLVDRTGDILSGWTRSNEKVHSDVSQSHLSTIRTLATYSSHSTSSLSTLSQLSSNLSHSLSSTLSTRLLRDVPTQMTPQPRTHDPIDRLLPLVDLDSTDRQGVMETLLRERDRDIARALQGDEERRLLLFGAQPHGEGGEDEEEHEGGEGGMSRSPSIEVVALAQQPTGRPRASSIVIPQQQGGQKGEMRKSRVLGERDSNIVNGNGNGKKLSLVGGGKKGMMTGKRVVTRKPSSSLA
ncbi:uncharacterized protein JCM6883_003461 [Sporobolomyces salmoneus]|uniref:uncharacterized protein n=1 Tax=Sporobolomyces salmoneus TaxID=183962 RepID=UPI003173A14B